MNLNALSLFVSVVQDGSLSKASERLNVPIATISRQITELEKSLNIQLFDRKKSGVKPTMAGQQLYEQVYQNIDNLLQVEKTLADNQEISGKLRISTFTGLEEVWAWIDEFCTLYPKVSIHCQVTDRVLDLVEDNIDFAFRAGNLHTDNAVARLAIMAKTKCLTHPTILAKYGTPQTPDDLQHFPYVGFAKAEQKELMISLENKVLKLPCVFTSNDVYAIAYLIQQGRGVGYLPETIANRLIHEYGLIEILSDYPMRAYPVHLLYLKHRYPSSVMRAFLDFVSSKLEVQADAIKRIDPISTKSKAY
ncbi:LysR family transcriptional regulator [Pelistega suis]|uniref:LysR family transcriptional regulator n=2 Tax=Pseudomonadota TaxID=1224 RepID=A0A849P700_9BURK|nr:LysR family transcriptional regulator [Pelistega suis]NOL51535.1 LysR family transcriptional regulator [Pelistega suis]